MKTILIVDDIFENLYILRVILERANFIVVEAKDGKDALEKLHKNSVDLIISDILMPVMDGYMFCQACKKDELFKNIPFVFYTSTYTEKSDEDFALKLGAAHFLIKPTDSDQILQLIQNLLTLVKSPVKPKENAQFTEKEVLKLYSKRLISKLEQKNLDLEKEIFEREKIEQKLINENAVLDLIANNTPIKKVFDHIIINCESLHPEFFGSISLLQEDGIHLDLISAPNIPKPYNLAVNRVKIGENVGSCGTAAFIKKPVIVSDISTDLLWVEYKDIALKHNLKSCWSVPILSEENNVLGTFAIYSKAIKTPSLEDIRELNSAVSLAKIAIVKFNIMAEVKKRDESYKSLVNQASDAILTYSFDGTIHALNKATYDILGYTKNEFLKLKFQDVIVGDIIESPEIHKKILNRKSVIFERQLICKNETLIEAEISARLQKDGKILAIVRDITERRKAELELKRAKEFSESLINSMQSGLSVIDSDSKHIHVNPALCEMTGYSKKELLGISPPFPYWPEEYYDEINEIVEKTLLGIYKGGETVFKRKNGERFPVEVTISRVKNEEGADVAFFASIDDISVKVKAREELNKTLREVSDLKSQLEQENIYLRNELDLVFNYEEMVYGSEAFSNVLTEVEKVAPTNATVLLLGESGTGKELLARAIHNIGLRNNKPLIKVNCSAIPRELLESELFGHKKGSFTGAVNDKIGKFELADGGTLFLDEIGELPLDMQPKILRFLQEGEIEVVGGTDLKKLDVRVIAATNRNLKEEIEKKQFREDLYFRLNVFPIEIPPLRKRKDDIPLLIEHFLNKFNKAYGKNIKYISDDSMNQLKAYHWPGNIRELENLIERSSILSTSETLLIPGFESKNQKSILPINSKNLSFDLAQRNHIIQVLEQCNWRISGPNGAAILLDLKLSTLRDKMAKLNIAKPQ